MASGETVLATLLSDQVPDVAASAFERASAAYILALAGSVLEWAGTYVDVSIATHAT